METVYTAGGELEKVQKVTELDKVNELDRINELSRVEVIEQIERIGPDHIFPAEEDPYIKGIRLAIDPEDVTKEFTYKLPQDMVLIAVSVNSSGYGDGDYWEAFYSLSGKQQDEVQFVETNYTKEIPETFPMVGFLGGKKLPKDSTIRIVFHNESTTYKTVWFTLRFLR